MIKCICNFGFAKLIKSALLRGVYNADFFWLIIEYLLKINTNIK